SVVGRTANCWRTIQVRWDAVIRIGTDPQVGRLKILRRNRSGRRPRTSSVGVIKHRNKGMSVQVVSTAVRDRPTSHWSPANPSVTQEEEQAVTSTISLNH